MKMKLPAAVSNRRWKKSKLVTIVAIVAVLAVFAAFAGNKPLAVQVTVAEEEPVKIWFSETGTVTAGDEYQVYTEVSGSVKQVYVEKGQYVEAGAVIAQLDTTAYQAEIAIHRANIKGHQAEGYLSAQGISVEQLQVQMNYSKERLDSYASLYNEGAISRVEYEDCEQEYAVLKSSLDQAVSQRSGTSSAYGAMAEGEQAAIALLEASIESCTITADRSGYVTQLPIASQSFVQAQTPVCVIQDQKGLLVETYVTTEDIAAVSEGYKVDLIQEQRQEDISYSGTVVEIGQWAEDQVSPLGVTEQRVKVLISPDEEMLSAAAGYGVTVRFTSFESSSAVALPKTAFFDYEGQSYVFIAGENQIVTAVPVERGSSFQGRTVVLAGVSPGDVVLADAAAEGIAEGVKVSWQ